MRKSFVTACFVLFLIMIMTKKGQDNGAYFTKLKKMGYFACYYMAILL